MSGRVKVVLTLVKVILESYAPGVEATTDRCMEPGLEIQRNGNVNISKPELLLFSANTEKSLNEHIQRLQDWIPVCSVPCSEVAYTMALHREHLKYRAYALIYDRTRTLVDISRPFRAAPTAPQVMMIFNGQGTQWPGMGKDLIENDYSFRGDVEQMDKILQTLTFPPSWKILGE